MFRFFGETLRQAGLLILSSTLVIWGLIFIVGLQCGIEGAYFNRATGVPAYAGVFAAWCDLREIVPYGFGYMMAAKVGTGIVAELGSMAMILQRVNARYRMEQGFTFELNLSGVSDEHRDAFAGTSRGKNDDKRTTLDEAVSSIESGMTIGIGGWGSRRKPMAFVRALLRTDVKDLTVVTYGGPDLGLLCSAGKVKRVYYGFVSLDSPPFYDPWFAKARTSGAIEAREMDEGMVRCGLQAAAQRLPFLPIRAGLGSDVRAFWGDELKTVKSPYPTGDGFEELIAMPALNLDAAFVHLNLGDAQGNAAYTGIDPYFDDLFLMAAQKRFLSVERVVPTEELIKAVPPQALLINRMMVDSVVEAPNGAHFTTAEPDYRRDEKFQRHYAEAAASDESWQEFVKTYLSGSEADYQAAVRKFKAESAKEADK